MLNILLIVFTVYLIVSAIHFAFLYYTAKSIGYHRGNGRLWFITGLSFFWPVTWIWFLVDRLSGRTT